MAIEGAGLILVSTELDIDMNEMVEKILKSDTAFLTNKHSGRFISNFTNDTQILLNVINGTTISVVKEFVTLIALVGLMFYQNWKLSILAIIMIPVAAYFSKQIGKKMGKVHR